MEICLVFKFSFTSQSCPVYWNNYFGKQMINMFPSSPKRFFWNLNEALFLSRIWKISWFPFSLNTKRSVSVNLSKIVHVNVTSAKSREYTRSFIIAGGDIAPSVTEETCCFVEL